MANLSNKQLRLRLTFFKALAVLTIVKGSTLRTAAREQDKRHNGIDLLCGDGTDGDRVVIWDDSERAVYPVTVVLSGHDSVLIRSSSPPPPLSLSDAL